MYSRAKHAAIALLAATAALSLSACTRTQTTTPSEILIGEYGALTGPESSYGLLAHKGIQMAINEANTAGGIRGKPIRLIAYDDRGKTDEAVTAVTRLITHDHVLAILGEVASTRSIAAGTIAQQYGIPMVSSSSTNPQVTQVGDFIFRVCFIDPFQGFAMATFATETLHLKTSGIFTDIKSDYSIGLAKFFRRAFEKRGGTVLEERSYASGDLDFKSQLTAFKARGVEALFIPGYYSEVGLITRQARELGFKGVFLGGDGWDNHSLEKASAGAIVGGYFANHFSPDDKSKRVLDFVSRYERKFGNAPNGSVALGYDAASVVIEALRRSPLISAQNVKLALSTMTGFSGVTGVLTFNKERNIDKPAVVLRIDSGEKHTYVAKVTPET